MVRKLGYPFALSCTVALALAAAPAGADPIDLTNISGTWQNPVGGSNVAGEGTPAISWGDGLLPDSGYLRAKVAQENLIKASGTPYSILRSTQFFEFGGRIADAASDGSTVRVPGALIQPILSDDVVAVLADVALSPPVNGIVEVGGPERFSFEDFIARALSVTNDKRKVVVDPHGRYFGTELQENSLVTGDKARIGKTRFDAWNNRSNATR